MRSLPTGPTLGFISLPDRKTMLVSYQVVEKRTVPQNRTILKDEIILFTGYYAKQHCPGLIRRIEVDDRDNNRVIVCLTNHFDFGATTIARIYQDRSPN